VAELALVADVVTQVEVVAHGDCVLVAVPSVCARRRQRIVVRPAAAESTQYSPFGRKSGS
jgi:hypothetical protein